MTDLERFFRRLVGNLAAMDPGRLHRSITVAEVSGKILPYRTSRRSLAIDTNEDYDAVLLRLVAGEGGYVHMVSDEIRQRFDREVKSPNPDLAVLRECEGAELILDTEDLAHALGPGPERGYAPPEPEIESPTPLRAAPRAVPPVAPTDNEIPLDSVRHSMPPVDFPAAEAARAPATDASPDHADGRCGFCGGRLPTGRAIYFCPFCGQNQRFSRCPACQSEMELGWRHCVNCGYHVTE
jgi:hypothetical protein